jgi:glycosyltransferase involved in cell wall biosynthesis
MAELKPPSVVIASSPYPSDVVAVLRLRRLGLAAAVYFHHLNPPPWWHPSRRGSPFRLLANWSFWTLGLAITKIAGFLPALDQPREMQGSGWVFPRVMPDPGFLTAEGEPPPRMEPPTYAACFVSRVAPNKGVVDLLRAWRRVVQVHPEAKLVIAGRCYYRGFEARLLRSIRRWGLDGRVEYRGFLPAEEKRDLLLRSQLFILPSYEEGWSLAVMEAAHYGTVPVVYDLPAYAYLGLEEVKVPVGDIGALAERIIGLLGDPHRRKAIAGALGANVRAYNRRAAAELQAHYLEDLARSSGLEQGGVARVSIRGRG